MTIEDMGGIEFGRPPGERGRRTLRELNATPVASCPQDMSIEEAIKLMELQQSTQLVVLDDQRRPIGLLDKEDLLRSVA